MALFKRKETPPPPAKKPKSLEEIVHERVLTAEGWHRKQLKKAGKPTKHSPK